MSEEAIEVEETITFNNGVMANHTVDNLIAANQKITEAHMTRLVTVAASKEVRQPAIERSELVINKPILTRPPKNELIIIN